MKQKIKRHYRSAVSVLLSVCMLISCMTVGLIATDAAKVKSGDDGESVGAIMEDDSSVSATTYYLYHGTSSTSLSKKGTLNCSLEVSSGNNYINVTTNSGSWNSNCVWNSDNKPKVDYSDAVGVNWVQTTENSGTYYLLVNTDDAYTYTAEYNESECKLYLSGGTAAPTTWTAVGDNTNLFGGAWKAKNTENDLTNTSGNTWSKTFPNVYLDGGKIEYKVAKNHKWATSYPSKNASATPTSAGYWDVTVTFNDSTHEVNMTFTAAATYTLTVASVEHATVTASYNGETASEGNTLTDIPQGATVALNVSADSGYKCTGYEVTATSGGATIHTESGSSSSRWEVEMPGQNATVTATMEEYAAPIVRVYFYNKYTQYPMVSVYAYYKSGGSISEEIFGAGKTMTRMDNSDIWYVDLPEDAYIVFMGDGYDTGELQPVTSHPTQTKYTPGSDRTNPGTGGTWGTYNKRTNVYTVNEGSTMSASNLFTGITATFYDYYVDHEVDHGWLSGIGYNNDDKDYKCWGSNTNDPFRTYLNKALSKYADNTNFPKNNTTYPLYFGNNKTGDNGNVSSDSTNAKYLFGFLQKPNNSDGLTPYTTSIMGLAGDTLAGNTIHHYADGDSVTDHNGAAMAFFDEDFLSGENSESKILASILHSSSFPVRKETVNAVYLKPNDNWKTGGAVFAARFWNGSNSYYVQMTPNSDGTLYAASVPDGYTKVTFCRYRPEDTVISSGTRHDGTRWNETDQLDVPTTGSDLVCEITGWSNASQWIAYTGSEHTHDYYEYDSTEGKDNAFIEKIDLNNLTAELNYYNSSTGKYVKSEAEDDGGKVKGFYPFDYNNIISKNYQPDKIYLEPGVWNSGTEWFLVKFSKSGLADKYDEFTDSGIEGLLSVDIPEAYRDSSTTISFYRKDPSLTPHTNYYNSTAWNNQENQSMPTDNKVVFNIYEWGGGNGKTKWKSNDSITVPFGTTSNYADTTNHYAHDLGFGMKMEIPFSLGRNGLNEDGTPQLFEFSGDDDLWVFVDDQLVLDMGGAHAKSTGSINFNTGKAVAETATAVSSNTTDGSRQETSFTIDTTSTGAENIPHTMTIYYLERGMFQSNLKFGFSFHAIPNQFKAEKKVRTRTVNSGLFYNNGLEGDASNMSDMYIDKGKRRITEFEKSFQTDEFIITHQYAGTLPDGDNPNDVTYVIDKTVSTVTRDGNNKFNYTLNNNNDGENIAYFNGQFETNSTMTMWEAMGDDNKYNYDPSIILYDEAENNIIFSKVTTVTQAGQYSGDNTSGYSFIFAQTDPPAEGGMEDLRIRARFENAMKNHALTITKAVTGTPDPTKKFTFEITFDFEGTDNYLSYPLKVENAADLPGTGVFELGAGESITFPGIPEKAKVRVREITRATNFVYKNTVVRSDSGSLHSSTELTGSDNYGATFTMGTTDLIATVTNTDGEPVMVSHNLHPDSIGNAYCYSTVDVWNPSTGTSVKNYSKQAGIIEVEAEYIKVDSANQLRIVLDTLPNDDYELNDFYEKIEDSIRQLRQQGIIATYTPDIANNTATVIIPIANLFNQTTKQQLYTELPFFSMLGFAARDVKIYKKITEGTSTQPYTVFAKTLTALDDDSPVDFSGTYKIYNASTDALEDSGTYTSAGISITPSQYVLLEGVRPDTKLEITEKELNDTYARAFHYAYSKVGVGSETPAEVTATTGAGPLAIDNGVRFTVSDDTNVEIYNKPWTYFVKYQYPAYLARYHEGAPNQWYDLTGAFTDADFGADGAMTIGSVSEKVCPVFKDDATKKAAFVSGRAPYQDNFMTTLTWNPTSDNTTIAYAPTDDTKNVSVTTTADAVENKNIQVYFKLPYNFKLWVENDETSLDPIPGDDGKILKIEGTYYRVNTEYEKWVTKNRSQDPEEAQWVEAPEEIYDSSGNKFVFRHWEMKSVGKNLLTNVSEPGDGARTHAKKDEYEYKRCYNTKLNMTFYQDSYVEPVYISADAPDASLAPAQREAKDTGVTLYGGAIINFLENSRNQWNDGGGTLYGADYENKTGRVTQGDRVFSDFLFSFNYNDIKLRSALGKYKTETVEENGETVTRRVFVPYLYNGNQIHFSYGFALEAVEGSAVDGETKTQEEYRDLYNSKAEGEPEAKTQMDAAIAYINGGSNSNFLLKEEYSAAALDNKNEIEYSNSIPVNNENHRENKVYRAFAYLRDYNLTGAEIGQFTWDGQEITAEEFAAITGTTHNGSILEISAPVYFTIRDMASVVPGMPYDDKGGQS